MRIAQRFILFVALPGVLCLVIAFFLLVSISHKALEREHQSRLYDNAIQIKDLMNSNVDMVKNDLETILANKHLEDYFMYSDVGELDYIEDVRATLEEEFLMISKSKKEYESIRLFTVDGEGVVNITDQRAIYRYPAPQNNEWFTSALDLQKGEFHVSKISQGRGHGEPSVYINQLFYFRGEPRGVLCIHLSTQEFFGKLLREMVIGKKGRAFLVDRGGKVIAHANSKMVGVNIADLSLPERVLAGEEQILTEQAISGDELMKQVYMPLGIEDAVLVAGQPIEEVHAVSKGLQLRLAGITLLVTIILSVLIFITVKTIINPLALLEFTTKKIAEGDLSARVNITGNDEVSNLSTSFDKMADSLQKTQEDLQKALSEVKTLSGFIPICSSCKKIRDDQGYWNQVESYIKAHSDAEFSHSICPDCMKKLYADFTASDAEQDDIG